MDRSSKFLNIEQESIDWTKAEKRTFLRHRLETRLASLYVPVYALIHLPRYLENKDYTNATKTVSSLLREVKKLDDKLLLVEIQ